jgi:hypothetical protein
LNAHLFKKIKPFVKNKKMEVDLDIYNDARYATNDDLKKLLLSIKNGLEVQLYSMYSIKDNNRDEISKYLLSYNSNVLNNQTISLYCLQLSAWLEAMYKFQAGESDNAKLIRSVQTLIETFDAIATLPDAEFAKFTITDGMKALAANYFATNPDKFIVAQAAIVTLARPNKVEPWDQYSEIVIDDMKCRVPFGAIVSIDRNTGLYRYIVPDLPTHSKVYIWPENVNFTFAFGMRFVFTPSTGKYETTPILDFEPLAPIIDSSASMAYYGKVVVLPLTYKSIEVPLPHKMDTTIKVFKNTTEIRAVCVTSVKKTGSITIMSETSESSTMQLLNPTDLAVLSHTGELLYVSNQYMPNYEQVAPMKVDNALQAINNDPPAAMTNLPTAPVMPAPTPITSTNYEQLRIQVVLAIANIQRNSYSIEKKGSTVYANVLYAQATEVYTSVVSLLNFGETIKEIKSMIEQMRADEVNLTAMTNVAWLTPKQYDDLYVTVAENRAIASQAIAVAYSILVMDAVYKQNILNFWNEWQVNKNNTALSALIEMRVSARNELKSYGIVFSESAITPTAILIETIVFPKINAKRTPIQTPTSSNLTTNEIIGIAVGVSVGVVFFIILFIMVFKDRKRKA